MHECDPASSWVISLLSARVEDVFLVTFAFLCYFGFDWISRCRGLVPAFLLDSTADLGSMHCLP